MLIFDCYAELHLAFILRILLLGGGDRSYEHEIELRVGRGTITSVLGPMMLLSAICHHV